jgi:hypothetical protein
MMTLTETDLDSITDGLEQIEFMKGCIDRGDKGFDVYDIVSNIEFENIRVLVEFYRENLNQVGTVVPDEEHY